MSVGKLGAVYLSALPGNVSRCARWKCLALRSFGHKKKKKKKKCCDVVKPLRLINCDVVVAQTFLRRFAMFVLALSELCVAFAKALFCVATARRVLAALLQNGGAVAAIGCGIRESIFILQ